MINRFNLCSNCKSYLVEDLELSFEAKKFLAKVGIDTEINVSIVDNDFLACNGAGLTIVNEVQEQIIKANLKRENINSIFRILNINKYDAKSLQLVEYASSLFNLASSGFYHVSIDHIFVGFDMETNFSSDSSLAIHEIAKLLSMNSNRNIVIHSSDKNVLKLIVQEIIRLHESDEIYYEIEKFSSLFIMSIDKLNLKVRAYNILLNELNIKTVGDLLCVGESGVRACRGAGEDVIENIKFALAAYNHELPSFFSINNINLFEAFKWIMTSTSLDELPIDMSQLSVRAKNVLMSNKLDSVGRVLKADIIGLMRLHNIGRNTISEILEVAKKQADLFVLFHSESMSTNFEHKIFPMSIPSLPSKNISDDIQPVMNALLMEVAQVAVISPFLVIDLIRENVYNFKDMQASIYYSLIFNTLCKHPWGLTCEEIFEFTSCFDKEINLSNIKFILNNLKSIGKSQFSGGLWFANELSLEDAINLRVKKERRFIVLARLRGETLASIGSKMNVTRERVRQIANNEFTYDVISGTRAARYLALLCVYELSECITKCVLGATDEEWNAAKYVKKAQYKHNSPLLSVKSLLEEDSLPARIKSKLMKEIH